MPSNPYQQPGASLSESRGFTGVDQWTNPSDMSGNELLAADNFINRSGQLYVRPGMVGLFGGYPPSSSSSPSSYSSSSSPSSNSSSSSSSSSAYQDTGNTYYSVPPSASYEIGQLVDGIGNTWMIFSFSGRIFKTQQGSGSYTELLDTNRNPYSLNSPVIDATPNGACLYIVDGAHDVIRVSLNGGFPAYAMAAPTGTPVVIGADTPIDTLGDTSDWAGFPTLNRPVNSTTGGLVTNTLYSHASRTASDPPPIGWQTGGGSADFGFTGTIPAGTFYEMQPDNQEPEYTDWEIQAPYYATVLFAYNDIAASIGSPTLISSVARPFVTADIGRRITFTAGANNNAILGTYTVEDVNAGVATLNNSCVTADATGITANLYDLDNTISTGRVYAGALSYRSVNGGTGTLDAILFAEQADIVRDAPTTFYPPINYTDLRVIAHTMQSPTGYPSYSAAVISSVERPFVTADVSRVILIQSLNSPSSSSSSSSSSSISGSSSSSSSGPPIIPAAQGVGLFTIIAVSGGQATLNGDCGPDGSVNGVGILGLEPGGTAWGNNNYTLYPPTGPKAAISAIDNQITVTPSEVAATWTGFFSYTTFPQDFDWLRYRVLGGGEAPSIVGVSLPALRAVDVRLIPTVTNGSLHIAANNPSTGGGWYLAGNWVRRDYIAKNGGTPVIPNGITDLVIGTDPTTVTSASYTFVGGDVDRFLIITDGTDFTPGRYQIISVATGVATLSAACGVAGSTGGTAYMLEADAPDYSAQSHIAIAYSSPQTPGSVTWRVGFQLIGTKPSAIAWTADAAITTDSTGTFLTVDVSTVPSDILAGARYLYLQIVNDLVQGADLTNIATLGAISAAGNLTVPGTYYWYVTESAKIDSANIIQSNPSPASLPFVTSLVRAQADVRLGSTFPQNAPTNFYNFYRLGGSWSDARLVATVPIDTDVAYGSDPINPYYSWDHTTKTLLDNTPDIRLDLAEVLSFGRNPMPANAQAAASWQGRYWQAVGRLVYGSWLYNSDNSALLYTTIAENAADPQVAIEGTFFPVGLDDADIVLRMLPYGTPIGSENQFGGGLLVLCTRSLWLIQGLNSTNFTVQQYPYTEGVGLVAFRGVVRLNKDLIAFLGPDRIHFFPPTHDTSVKDPGLDIQPSIYPVTPQVEQDQTAFSKSWMIFHDQKIFLGCPVPGGTQNSVVWIYDLRVGGWTRWTGPKAGGAFPQAGMPITSAASLSPNKNGAQYDLYLFGLDGQLYRMTGTVDQYSPLSMTAGIPFLTTVHACRPQFFVRFKGRGLLYMKARLEWTQTEMNMNGPITVSAIAYDTGTDTPVPISSWTQPPYTLNNGGFAFRQDWPVGLLEAQFIAVTLTGTVTGVAFLRGVRNWVSATGYEQD